ncbi:MAG: hypothetical protein HY695_36260 [Deltaproteobacteria bacterium]|nr:hypothetical protein [Deltaproteobacteria bacterium]
MRPRKDGFSFWILAVMLAVTGGCEEIALVGRPTIGEPDEIVGEVERVDAGSREIVLRTGNRQATIVGYLPETRVIYRGHEFPVTHLEKGDIVSMRVQPERSGRSRTDLINVRKSARDADRSPADSTSEITMLVGTVERVDYEGRWFELRERSGGRVTVSVPRDARASQVEQFKIIRPGDSVLVEGRFIDRGRFEVEAFL